MTVQDLNFLKSTAGSEILERYESFKDEDLYRLLFKSVGLPAEKILPSVVTLIKLRRQAASKFTRASELFFTTLGLEQATSEAVAEQIASRFPSNWKVVDLTCGLGGNLISLARRCRQVVAVDQSEVNIICAQENARVYGVSDKIEFIMGDAYFNLLSDADAFFLDPARDREGRSKTRSILNSEPELLKILPEILKVSPNVGVKISPAFDYRELEALPEKPEIEIISEDNTCKVAMLWFGKLKTAERRATCLVSGKKYEFVDNPELSPTLISETDPVYLYEPNKAISKAHLLSEAALTEHLFKLDPYLSFLTGARLIGDGQPGLWRRFKVLNSGHFSLKEMKKFLKEKKIIRANIIAKHFPLLPDEIYARLKLKEGGDFFLILVTLNEKMRWFFWTQRV